MPEVTEPVATLTVAAVARRLGVAPATLRTWARRYGLGPSQHTAGSHRRYTQADLTRLLVMRRLTHEGLSPAQAAQAALASPENQELPEESFLDAGIVPSGTRASRGGGRVVPLPQASVAVRGLARAAMALDAHGVSEVLRRAVRTEGVVTAWDTLAVPVLVGLGERFAASHDAIEVEHMFSECLMGVLRAATDHLQTPRNTVGVLLACVGDEQHSLPLYAMAAALAERGVGVRQLGMRVPPQALASAVRRCGPGVVVVYAVLPVSSLEAIETIARIRPAPRVLVGGPGWPATLPAGVSRVRSVGEAVDSIVSSVL